MVPPLAILAAGTGFTGARGLLYGPCPAASKSIVCDSLVEASTMAVTVREYETADGKVPFRDWLDTLDRATRARVQARVVRFETGNLGDHKGVGGGVQEARVMFGPGYRLYFGQDGATLVLLLVGGSKGTQAKDIRRAQQYWRDYLGEK